MARLNGNQHRISRLNARYPANVRWLPYDRKPRLPRYWWPVAALALANAVWGLAALGLYLI